MAEALAAISAFSAVASLVSEFAQLGIRLNYYARHLKHAQREIEEIDLEVSTFNVILKIFNETVNRPEARNMPLMQEAIKAGLATKLKRHSEMVLSSADTMLCKLKPLRDDKGSSFWGRGIARFIWIVEKDEVQPLKTTLNSIKLSMQLFYTNVLISDILGKINAQGPNGYDVSRLRAELKRLKKELRSTQDRCIRAEKRLEAQQSHFSLGLPLSSELSRTVDALVRNERGRQRKERQERGSNPSSSPHMSPTASTLSGNIAAAEFPRPLNLVRNRPRPSVSDSLPNQMSSVIPTTFEHILNTRRNPRERGWVPTALFASEPEPRVERSRSRSPQDVVVDDNENPVHVVRRPPRTQPGVGSDGC